jgi:hypothetical protein
MSMKFDVIGDSVGLGNGGHVALGRKEGGWILRINAPTVDPYIEWRASFKLNGVQMEHIFQPGESSWDIHINDENAEITSARLWATKRTASGPGSSANEP